MADNGSTPPPFDIANFMGGLIMELCIGLMYVEYHLLFKKTTLPFAQTIVSDRLYGVTTAQAYVYLLNSKKDPWWLKLMVAAVW